MAAPSDAVDRLIAKVKNNLGRTNDTVVTDYTIVWINEAQKEVCNRANFWFMHTETTLSFAQSDTEKALPSNFKDEDAVWILETTPDGFTELEPMSIEDHRRYYDDTVEAKPSHWRIDASNNLILRPVPDDSYTVQIDYWAYLTDLTDPGASATNELVDGFPDILETGATYRGLRRLGELEDAIAWRTEFDRLIQDLKVENAERILPDEFVLRVRPDALGTTIQRPKGRLR